MDLGTQLARCRACDSVFSFRGAIEDEARGPQTRPPLTPRPRRIRVQDQGDALIITRPWYRPWHLFAGVVFVILMLVIAGLLVYIAKLAPEVDGPFGRPVVRLRPLDAGRPLVVDPTPARPWYSRILRLVALPFVIIGLVVGYVLLSCLVNATVIRLDRRLSIRHGPLPWPGNRTLDASQVRQLYVVRREQYYRRYMHHHRHHLHTAAEPVLLTWFDLRAVLADGTSLTLIDGIEDEEEAAWLERAIEQRLGIADQPVHSEFRPQ